MRIRRALPLGLVLCAACASSTPPPAEAPSVQSGNAPLGPSSPHAPKDRVVAVSGPADENPRAKMFELLAPHVAQAKATYPQAKQRYLAGLARGETLFVTVRLFDPADHFEQVFIRVDHIEGTRIEGRIASEIVAVQGYHSGDHYALNEPDLVDWLISKPDGSEEGNYVGKFMDTLH